MSGLKKNMPNSLEKKRKMIDPAYTRISIRRQCELLGLNRSTYYMKPAGESSFNLMLMELIDKQYTKTPFYGYPKMTAWLRRENHLVNKKRVARLMRLMGLQAILAGYKIATAEKSMSSDLKPLCHTFYNCCVRYASIVLCCHTKELA